MKENWSDFLGTCINPYALLIWVFIDELFAEISFRQATFVFSDNGVSHKSCYLKNKNQLVQFDSTSPVRPHFDTVNSFRKQRTFKDGLKMLTGQSINAFLHYTISVDISILYSVICGTECDRVGGFTEIFNFLISNCL